MDDIIRVMLVDDQRLFIESLKIVLENLNREIRVVGIAENGEEAIRQYEEMDPQIILMDVRMPVMDGVAAGRAIKKKSPEIKIIMLTTFEDDDYVTEAMTAGAEGYMLKNIDPPMLVSAINAVAAGSILISPRVAGNLIHHVYENEKDAFRKSNRERPEWYGDLSPREKQILRYMLQERTNGEIAEIIHVGDQTIRNYISTIYSKLNVPNRREALEKIRTLPEFFYE